ncbi:Origin recognition complex subunit 2, partial [Thoreauomyces humboldtii]
PNTRAYLSNKQTPQNMTGRQRQRHLQTGLTASLTPKSSKVVDSLPEVVDCDQEVLEALHGEGRAEEDNGSAGDKENDDGSVEDAQLPSNAKAGKDLYAFPSARKKSFKARVELGNRTLRPDLADSELPTADDAGAQTPSRKRVMMLAPGDEVATPTRSGKRTKLLEAESPTVAVTPAGRRGRKLAGSQTPETPAPVRQERRRKANSRLATVIDDASSEEDDSEDSEEDQAEVQHPVNGGTVDDGEDEHSQHGEEDEEEDGYDREAPSYQRYFANLHDSLAKTSNNTLSKLPALSHETMTKCLATAPVKHKREIAFLESLHVEQFDQWLFELKEGFNLLFYGYGSKRDLLNQFATETLNDGGILVVNGFFPGLTIRSVLKNITDTILLHTGPVGSVHDHLALVMRLLKEPIYLIVHNIDGQALRSPTAQLVLSSLAAHPFVHLVASIDHINAPLLWDNVHQERYNWVWHDITTFASYSAETSMEGSLMSLHAGIGVGAGPRMATGVIHVLRALNKNARTIFKILCDHQMQEDGGGEADGLSYSAWFAKARQQFVVSNDMTFRAQLGEFRDHRIIVSKGTGQEEMLSIPLDKAVLESIMETMAM